MGAGSELADVVVNALYPHECARDNTLVGDRYFCLRDEFLYIGRSKRTVSVDVSRILLTFGGVDEGDLTGRVLHEIAPYCIERGIALDVVVGPGYNCGEKLKLYVESLGRFNCNIISKTKRISEFMVKADIAITSAGRTVLELAAVKRPMIVICQNERETTHTFASEANGIVNLGHREKVNDGEILSSVKSLCSNMKLREDMVEKMTRKDFSKGKERVIKAILELM